MICANTQVFEAARRLTGTTLVTTSKAGICIFLLAALCLCAPSSLPAQTFTTQYPFTDGNFYGTTSCGGFSNSSCAGLNLSSELYNRASGTWSTTGNAGTTIINAIAPRLPSGQVFVTGSFASGSASYSTATLYDRSTGKFTVQNGLCNCGGFKGSLIITGKILVAGGFISVHKLPSNITETIASAELWDPSTQTWSSTRNLNTSRGAKSVTILSNGQALLAGGDTFDKQTGQLVITTTAELYTT